MASKSKNIEYLSNVFGDRLDVILNVLDKENINITNRSTNFVFNIANLVFNYVDFIYNGDISVIENKTFDEIKNEYDEWFLRNNKKPLQITNNLEIIYDYRKNDLGYFWVNLHSNFSSEMMFNMENCGRVGVNQNLILLIEQTNDNQLDMHVVIVINKDKQILQVKGKNNTKPTKFYDQIFDFFMKYESIMGFKLINSPENDFTKLDLTREDCQKLKLIKPHLFDKVM